MAEGEFGAEDGGAGDGLDGLVGREEGRKGGGREEGRRFGKD